MTRGLGTREGELFVTTHRGEMVHCLNVRAGCLGDNCFSTPCPHSLPYPAGDMCRLGVCPVTFKRLSCQLDNGGEVE